MLQPSQIKKIEKLKRRKWRDSYRLFLLESVKGILEAIEADAHIEDIIIEDKRRNQREIESIISAAQEKDILLSFANQSEIGKIKSTDTFPGALAIIKKQTTSFDELDFSKPMLLLDAIQDPGNLGTIIRTADWFGVQNILLGKGTVDLYNEKVVRSTMGSIFHSRIVELEDTGVAIEELKSQGYSIVSLATGGGDIQATKPKQKTVYLIGNESRGVQKEHIQASDKIITIPGSGGAESLNAAIAVGILCYALTK